MIGQTISHYKILEKLGEGGMGVVYKAHDTNLDRLVALKFLPDHFSVGSAELERFVQEAKAAAGLNHPNICTIYGIEESEGKNPSTSASETPSLGVKKHFIVMEFVDGQTLQEKKSSLSMKQALDVGIQIAEGLAAAHEKGIVHRDIKPENIMIRKDGRVQIMDFGLAKLRGATRLTKEGSTVGTAGYMSPEQVQEQETDHRSDIFSLGVLLYEMLTGQPPFKGIHETAISYEIVNVDSPPMSSIKTDISPELDAIVLECLEKDSKERTQSASQVAVDLKRYRRESSRSRASRITSVRTGPSGISATPRPGSSSEVDVSVHFDLVRLYQVLAVAGLLLAVTLLVLWAPWQSTSMVQVGVTRTTVSLPEKFRLALDYSGSSVAISPDGRTIAFVAFIPDSVSQGIFIRPMSSYDSRFLVRTAFTGILFSQDGQWIYYNGDEGIMKISVTGGAPIVVSASAAFTGLCRGVGDDLYIGKGMNGGISTIQAGSNNAEPLIQPDTSLGEVSLRHPSFVPEANALLFTIKYGSTATFDEADIGVLDLETGRRKKVLTGGTQARYIPTGHIVYLRGGSFFVVPFDESSLEVTGAPKELFPGGMMLAESGTGNFDVANDGTLVYAPGGPAPLQRQTIEWLTTLGKTIPLLATPRGYSVARVSPDGSRLAIQINAANNDIWIYDIMRETLNRLTFGGGNNGGPIWRPDGKMVAYYGPAGLLSRRADGSGETRLIRAIDRNTGSAWGFSPDGKYLVYSRRGDVNWGLWALPMDDPQAEFPVVQTPFAEFNAKISPDGKLIAYMSTESGTAVTYAAPFPRGEGRWRISKGQSKGNWWSRDGKDIYYIGDDNKLYAVPIQAGRSIDPGSPRLITDHTPLGLSNLWDFDLDPARMRWLVIRAAPNEELPSYVNVIAGWFNELTGDSRK